MGPIQTQGLHPQSWRQWLSNQTFVYTPFSYIIPPQKRAYRPTYVPPLPVQTYSTIHVGQTTGTKNTIIIHSGIRDNII